MSNVALCESDIQRLKASTGERPRYSRAVGASNVSAFLMKFPGTSAIFVEFSQPGNALYWHDAAKFEKRAKGGITQSTLHISEDLKNQGTMRDKISQCHAPVRTAANTKIDRTITISKNAVPQRTCSWEYFLAYSASMGSPAS